MQQSPQELPCKCYVSLNILLHRQSSQLTSMLYFSLAVFLKHRAGMQGRKQLRREQQKAELRRLLAFWQTRQGLHHKPKQPQHNDEITVCGCVTSLTDPAVSTKVGNTLGPGTHLALPFTSKLKTKYCSDIDHILSIFR